MRMRSRSEPVSIVSLCIQEGEGRGGCIICHQFGRGEVEGPGWHCMYEGRTSKATDTL